jgi:hypothetical protein
MDKFEIGEIAIIVAPGEDFNGEEVEIIGTLGPQSNFFAKHECAYPVLFKDGRDGWATPAHLRKKRPPRTNRDIEETKEKGCGDWPFLKELLFKDKENVKT